jgi:hypothetical protein
MIDRLLSTLQRVRAKGDSSWTALCPCHQDKTPSLHVNELPDGTVLAHCFGCDANGQKVAEALGIPLSDLFPPRPHDTPDGPGGRGPYTRDTRNLLAAVAHEALIIAVAMEAEWRGEEHSLEDEDRVFEAVRRLREIACDIAR